MHSLSSSTCTSLSCVSAAEKLRSKSAAASHLPSHISPCDDFYEYACAGWKENTINRASFSPEWNIALETSFRSYDKIKQLFDRLTVTSEQQRNLTTYQSGAVVTYEKCMKESIEDTNEALQFSYKDMGGWLSTSSDKHSLEDTLIGAYRTNAICLFHINAQIDAKDVRAHTVLTVEEATPYLGMLKPYGALESFNAEDLAEGRMKGHWLDTIFLPAGVEMAMKLGMSDTAELRSSVAQAILLDYKISRCSPQFDYKLEATGDKPEEWRTTLADLEDFDHLFNFRFFLELFIGRDISSDTEIVIAPGRAYFDRVMAVLAEYSSDEGRKIIKDYIKFKQLFMLYIYSGKLTHSKSQSGLEYLRTIYMSGEVDRTRYCINRVAAINQHGFVSLLEQFWSPQLQENMEYARKIGESLRREYIDELRKSDVIDEVDRAAMIEKAERIRIRVAVPEAARDEEALLEESKMFINDTDYPWAIYFTTVLGNRHWQRISRFGKPLSAGEWPTDTSPFNINVHYNYESNSILFPIIWTMEQYIDTSLPSFYSFAGFGSIIGHEMTHAFDFKGRCYGPSGVDHNLTSGRTSKNFETKEQCFREQYTALGGQNNLHVLGENVADNVALKLAYKGWKAQHELSKKILPGIEMTAKQAFFTAYAQNWCTAAKVASGNTHSIGKLRVLGPLQNSREFSEAFACPVGSFMNPSKKCALW